MCIRDRSRLAAYDIASEALSEQWAPQASEGVKGLIVDPDKIWVSGDFFRMNGQRARGLTTVDPDNGALLPIDSPDVWVIDIAAQGNRIFVAGGGPGGVAMAFDRTTGDMLWETDSNGNFQAVDVYGDYVYFGGHHTKIFPISRDDRSVQIPVGQVSRHDIATGVVDESWLPFVNGLRGVNAVDASADGIFIGGDFTFVARMAQEGFAGFTFGVN